MAHHLFNQVLTHQVSEAAAAVEQTDENFKDTVLLLKGDGSDGQGNTADLGNPSYKAFEDKSTSTHAITVNGDSYGNDFSPYYYDDGYWSNEFDGSSLITFPSSTDFVPGEGAFCLEFWVFPITSGWLVGNRSGGYHPMATYLDVTNTRIIMWMSSNGSSWDIFANHYANGILIYQWNHIALVRSSSNSIVSYVNGSGTYITSSSASFTSAQNFYVGGSPGGADGDMTGYISNVRFVKGSSMYFGPFTPSTTPFTDPTTSGELSVYFDGTGDYLTVPDSTDFTIGTNNFSLEFWIYPTRTATQEVFYSQSNSAGSSYPIIVEKTTANKLYLYMTSSAQNYQLGTTILSMNQWYFIQVKRTDSQVVKLYLNGTEEISLNLTTSTIVDAVDDVQIGRAIFGRQYQGYISNLRFRLGAASPYSTLSVPTTPLTSTGSETKLLTCQSKTFSDESDSSQPISIYGDARISEFGPFGDGYWSNYFDGNGDSLEIANSTDFKFGTGDFTIECWLFPTVATQQSYGLVVKCAANSNWTGGWAIAFQNSPNNGKISFWVNNSQLIGSGTALNQNRWNHIAVTRSGSTTNLYQNGSRVATATNSYDFQPTQALTIASDLTHTAYEYQGYIKDLRILKGTALYTGTSYTQPTTNLEKITNTVLLTCQSNRFFDNSDSEHTVSLGDGTPQVSELIPFEYLKRQTKLITSQGNRFKDIIPDRHSTTLTGTPKVSTNIPFTQSKTANVGSGYFDGSGDYLALPASTDFDLGTGNFTIEFWAYVTNDITSDTTNQMAISATHTTGRYINFRNGSTYGRIQITVGGQDYNINLDSNPRNAWHHFAVVRKNSTTVELFYDGASMGTITVGASEDFDLSNGGSNECRIGAWYNGGYPFFGYLSNFRIIKGTALYTSNFTPSTSTLTTTSQSATASEVKLLTCQYSGAVRNVGFLDDSKYNHEITRINDATMGTFSPFSAEDGYWSVYFDGSDALRIPASTMAFGTGDFTIQFWLYYIGCNGTYGFLYDARTGASGTDHYLQILASSDELRFRLGFGAVGFSTGYTIPKNEWSLLTVTRQSGRLKIHRNTTEIYDNENATANLDRTGDLEIGYSTNDNNWGIIGYISNWRVKIGTAEIPSSLPSEPFTDSSYSFLGLQSNRFVDNSTNDVAHSIPTGTPQIQPFSPFAPTRSYSKDVVGGSVYNDGSDGLKITNANRALRANDFEFEFWYYPTTSSGNKYLIGADFGPILLYVPSGGTDVRLYSDNDGSTPWNIFAYKTLGNIKINQWNHIYLSRVSSAFYAFINGTASSQNGDAWSTFYSLQKPFYIGTYDDSGSGAATGYISNLKFNIGTGSTTKSVPTAPTTPDSNTYVHVNFTNAGIIDHSSKHNIQTVNNTRISTTTKKFGTGSVYFDGTGDYLKILSSKLLTFGTGDFTIEMFVYATKTTEQALYDGRSANGAYPYILIQNTSNKFVYYVSTGVRITSNDTVSLNQWIHLAIARSNGTTKMFVDGTEQTGTYTDSTNYLAAPVVIGQNQPSGGENFEGYLDEVRVTKGVARYTSTFTPPTQTFPNK